MSSNDSLARLAAVIESRKPANGGDPQTSYVSRLLHKGPDAFLKKIGEEATEVVLAAKGREHGQVVYETSAAHDGRWNSTESLWQAMLDAALQGFPSAPEGRRRIDIDVPR